MEIVTLQKNPSGYLPKVAERTAIFYDVKKFQITERMVAEWEFREITEHEQFVEWAKVMKIEESSFGKIFVLSFS